MNAITLDTPVTVDGVTYETLTVKRGMKVKDQLSAARQAAQPEEREILIAGWLCGVPRAVIEELDIADYGKLQEAMVGFTRRSADGPTPPTSDPA